MRIGIDARLINETGVGRYIRNLIAELGTIDEESSYVVFLKRDAFDSFKVPNSRWQKRLADVSWHSVAEQFVMPWLLVKEHLDLVHIPYFNVPIFYPGKFIVTIHDLTILHFDTGKATTLPLPFYKLRRLGYYMALAVGLRRASKIIAVSNTTKQEIIDHFQIDPGKIAVTHEGMDLGTKNRKKIIEDPYFLYVGNAYPHKNLETLLKAFAQLITPYKVKLVLVGKDDFFYKRIRETVKTMGLVRSVIFFGPANEEQLPSLYGHAIALVFPSLMEGFGLPAVEALAVGCPVICSNIAVFTEILGNLPIYFETTNVDQLADKMKEVLQSPPSAEWKKKATLLASNFDWGKMSKETLCIYADIDS
jgi:glycosyltransferase involved in cell wall biosynthesis